MAVRSYFMVIAIGILLTDIGFAEVDPKEGERETETRQGSLRIEEVVVTAQRREQSIQDVPITMSAFTGEQFRERGVIDTRDLEKMVPGFKFTETGFNVPVFTLRGVGFDDESQTASGTVGLYVDEFNLPFPVMAKGPNLDLQRIEVMKGPQGTLYGINTTAGAINYVTNKPTETFEAGFTAIYGRFETSDLEGYVSGGVTDSIGMRLSFRQVRSGEGWQKSLTRPNGPNGELGKIDKLSGRYIVEWSATDTVSVSLSVDAWADKSDPQAAAPVAIVAGNPFLGEAALSSQVRDHPTVPFDTDDMRVAAWPQQSLPEVPDWQLDDQFLMGRFRLDWDAFENAGFSYLVSYGEFESDDSAVPITGLSVLNNEGLFNVKTNFSAHEVRLSGIWRTNFDYDIGVFFSRNDVSDLWTPFFHTMSAFFPHDTEGNTVFNVKNRNEAYQESDTKAVFFNLHWQFIPSMGVTAGGRYAREARDYEGCTRDTSDEEERQPRVMDIFNAISITEGGGGGAQPGECYTLDSETREPGLVKKTLEEDSISSRFAFDWSPNEDLLFYLSFSRGFKAGSFPRFGAGEEVQFEPATQERLDSWELGGKLSFFKQLSRLNFAIFHYDYKDKQLLGNIPDPVFGVLNKLVNAPESKIVGGEVEAQIIPIKNLDFTLSATYLNSKIIEFTGINNEGEEEDFAGNRLNNTPRWSGAAGINYRWRVPVIDMFEMSAGVDYSYMGKTNSSLSEDRLFKLSSYSNVDYRFSIGHVDQSWKFAIWGRNVTNEYQPVSARRTGGADAVARFSRMPQTYGISFHYDYR